MNNNWLLSEILKIRGLPLSLVNSFQFWAFGLLRSNVWSDEWLLRLESWDCRYFASYFSGISCSRTGHSGFLHSTCDLLDKFSRNAHHQPASDLLQINEQHIIPSSWLWQDVAKTRLICSTHDINMHMWNNCWLKTPILTSRHITKRN